MPSFLPPPSSQPEPRRKPVDVRTLSLAQLHHFAKRGSRSAKAELERRMSAADEAAARTPAAPAPRPRPAPARPAVDLDIGSKAAPTRRFTAAPFPSTEMLGDLLPLADSPTHPLTQAYSIDVQPEDVPPAAPQEAAPAAAPVFQKTEVLDDGAKPPAASAPHAAPAREPRPAFIESRAPSAFGESHTPSAFRESQPHTQPPLFRESRTPHSQLPHSQPPHTQPPQFRESHPQAPDSRPPAPARRKARRPAGVPSRPMPLHIPENSKPPAPSSILDDPDDKVAERLAAISRQESAQNRADDVPRFIGLIIMIWGVLAALTGMVLLASGHGFYVLACGAASCYVGWLLFKLKRLALPLHIVFLVAALIWAWSGKSSSMLEVLTQSMPLLIPAIWMLVPSIREPLH